MLEIKLNSESQLVDFINTANSFDSCIDLYKGSRCVDAKSILGVIALGLFEPMEVILLSTNEQEIKEFKKEMERFRWDKEDLK